MTVTSSSDPVAPSTGTAAALAGLHRALDAPFSATEAGGWRWTVRRAMGPRARRPGARVPRLGRRLAVRPPRPLAPRAGHAGAPAGGVRTRRARAPRRRRGPPGDSSACWPTSTTTSSVSTTWPTTRWSRRSAARSSRALDSPPARRAPRRRWPRRGAGVADRNRLESGRWQRCQPRVRIPPPLPCWMRRRQSSDELDQRVALLDDVAGGDLDGRDGAGGLGDDRDLHLHRLEQHDGVTDGDRSRPPRPRRPARWPPSRRRSRCAVRGPRPETSRPAGLRGAAGCGRGSGRSAATESSVRARRPGRDPVSSRSRRMITAPMSTPRITEYSVVSPASTSVSDGSRNVWVTCAAAVTPNAQTHQPCRRRARMWTPHIRAGTPSNAWTGRGAPCSVSQRPLAAVEQRVDELGGAVPAQHLGVGQRQRQHHAADEHDHQASPAESVQPGTEPEHHQEGQRERRPERRVREPRQADRRLEPDDGGRPDQGDEHRHQHLADGLERGHGGDGRHHREHGRDHTGQHRGAGAQHGFVGHHDRGAERERERAVDVGPAAGAGHQPGREHDRDQDPAGLTDPRRDASGVAPRARQPIPTSSSSTHVPTPNRRPGRRSRERRGARSARRRGAVVDTGGKGTQPSETTVGEGRVGAASLVEDLAVEGDRQRLGVLAGLGQHLAPRVDHERVPGVARAGLADGDDVRRVLDRARPDQRASSGRPCAARPPMRPGRRAPRRRSRRAPGRARGSAGRSRSSGRAGSPPGRR